MPLQIWTRDQVPELTALGGRALAEGVSGGVGKLVRGFTEAAEERKRLGQVAKASESFLKSLSNEERESLNLPDADTFGLMGAKDKIGTITGALQAQGYKKAHQEMALRAEHIKALQEEAANAAQEPAFLSRVAELGQAPEDVPGPVGNEEFDRRTRPLSGQAVLGAAAASGYRPKLERIAPLLKELTDMNASRTPARFEFEDVPDTNFKAWRLGKSAGMLPKEGGALRAATDEEGNAIEGAYTTPRGAMFQPRAAKELPPTFHKVMDEVTSDMAGAEATLADPAAPAARRTRARAMLESARKRGQQTVERYRASGYQVPEGVGAAPAADRELEQAQEALKAGASRAKVGALYRQRTGKDLP